MTLVAIILTTFTHDDAMKAKYILLVAIPCLVSLAGCVTREVMTEVSPYKDIIGRRYVLNDDCYIFNFKGSQKELFSGAPRFDCDLRRALDKEHFPQGFGSIVVREHVASGNSFGVTEVIRERNIETTVYWYLSRLEFADGRTRNVNITPLMKHFTNPMTVDERIATEQK